LHLGKVRLLLGRSSCSASQRRNYQ